MSPPDDETIAAAIMDLAHRRGAGRTFCPSEVARALLRDWRPLMPRVRAVATTLPVQATQGETVVDPLTARGPIRLGLKT